MIPTATLAALVCAAVATVPPVFDVGRHCDVTSSEFGAVGDNRTDCTRAFRAATAACGTVSVPAGTFRTAAFNLTSNQLLSLAAGTTLVAQPDRGMYPTVLGLPPMGTAGRGKTAPCALVSAYWATNVSVVGAGRDTSVIDGLGWQWWQNYTWKGTASSKFHRCDCFGAGCAWAQGAALPCPRLVLAGTGLMWRSWRAYSYSPVFRPPLQHDQPRSDVQVHGCHRRRADAAELADVDVASLRL